MNSPTRHLTGHLTRCMIAGIVALLPMGGAVLTVVWLENTIAGAWQAAPGLFYFPGLGLLLALLLVYLLGLFVTTFVGRWLWRRLDRFLSSLPLVGAVYDQLKELLGYDSARERFFQGVVAVEGEHGFELGLITAETTAADGQPQTVVFVPSAPNPANGRLLFVPPQRLRRLEVRSAAALRTLLSVGKSPLAESP